MTETINFLSENVTASCCFCDRPCLFCPGKLENKNQRERSVLPKTGPERDAGCAARRSCNSTCKLKGSYEESSRCLLFSGRQGSQRTSWQGSQKGCSQSILGMRLLEGVLRRVLRRNVGGMNMPSAEDHARGVCFR